MTDLTGSGHEKWPRSGHGPERRRALEPRGPFWRGAAGPAYPVSAGAGGVACMVHPLYTPQGGVQGVYQACHPTCPIRHRVRRPSTAAPERPSGLKGARRAGRLLILLTTFVILVGVQARLAPSRPVLRKILGYERSE